MTRVLVAGQAPERKPQPMRDRVRRPALFEVKPDREPVRVPRLTTFITQQAAVDELGRQLADLEALHRMIGEHSERIARLQVKLADPALFHHPRRIEAEQRYEALVLDRNALQGRRDAVVMVIARIYCSLAPETRTELMATGWAPSRTPEQVRAWLESCLAVGWLPHEEAPF